MVWSDTILEDGNRVVVGRKTILIDRVGKEVRWVENRCKPFSRLGSQVPREDPQVLEKVFASKGINVIKGQAICCDI